MATPRCLRPMLAPCKRIQIISPRQRLAGSQTFIRKESSRADRDGDEKKEPFVPSKRFDTVNDLVADVKNSGIPLDERLAELDIDPKEYQRLVKSMRTVQVRQQRSVPWTNEFAEKQWKKMQNTPDHMAMLRIWKGAGAEPIKMAKERGITLPNEKTPLDPETAKALAELRDPINVQAIHLRPLRREPEHGVPVCDLQLRTYSIRSLLLFADFAVRAAYYMGLCARGPIPLPRITERWTVPRANFIFKKSQENFERITMRRLIQIQDGHPDVVKAWLAFLQKHQYYGVGMKANIWEFEDLATAARAGYDIKEEDYSRRREGPVLEKVEEILKGRGYAEAMKGFKLEDADLRP